MSIRSDRPRARLRSIRLGAESWFWFLVVAAGLRLLSLPDLVARLGSTRRSRSRRFHPRRLSRTVDRVLRVGAFQPRCLTRSLVLYRLLREQGEAAEVVIGLPDAPTTRDAHAWVEIQGLDVGPAPGRGRHQELARYGPLR